MIMQACGRCGKIHRYGDCSVPVKPYWMQKKYRKQDVPTEERRFRSSAQWRHKREQILQRDKYVCRLCLHFGTINTDRLQVHHIVKIRDNNDLKLVDDNLITLCPSCHERVENDPHSAVLLRMLAKTPPHKKL